MEDPQLRGWSAPSNIPGTKKRICRGSTNVNETGKQIDIPTEIDVETRWRVAAGEHQVRYSISTAQEGTERPTEDRDPSDGAPRSSSERSKELLLNYSLFIKFQVLRATI